METIKQEIYKFIQVVQAIVPLFLLLLGAYALVKCGFSVGTPWGYLFLGVVSIILAYLFSGGGDDE